jgi:F-type H+-transporting ATPase subunit a
MEEHHASWLNALVALEPAWLRPYLDVFVIHVLLVILLLSLLAWRAGRRLESRPTRKLQLAGEWVYESLENLCRSLIPHHGERYTPLIGGLFLYILCLNLFGLIPGFLSPTSRLNTTVALGLSSIILAQVVGWRVNGPRYLKRWVPSMAGVPAYLWFFFFPLMFVLHIVEELVKPLSLSIRLFGNIFGDDTAVAQFALLGAGALGTVFNPLSASVGLRLGGVVGALLGVGITSVMISFAIFVALIQALVFSILTAAYALFAIEME